MDDEGRKGSHGGHGGHGVAEYGTTMSVDEMLTIWERWVVTLHSGCYL